MNDDFTDAIQEPYFTLTFIEVSVIKRKVNRKLLFAQDISVMSSFIFSVSQKPHYKIFQWKYIKL